MDSGIGQFHFDKTTFQFYRTYFLPISQNMNIPMDFSGNFAQICPPKNKYELEMGPASMC